MICDGRRVWVAGGGLWRVFLVPYNAHTHKGYYSVFAPHSPPRHPSTMLTYFGQQASDRVAVMKPRR